MDEQPKFDPGISELAEYDTGDLDSEKSTALKFFRSTEGNNLYEGAGYIWKRFDLRSALFEVPDQLKSQVRVQSDEITLQNIARLAKKDFNRLTSLGIKFYGEFIVHDVNNFSCLITAVPKQSDKSKNPSDYFKSPEEWRKYAQAFINLHKRLLMYFDQLSNQNLPLLWDVSKFEQYVFDEDEKGAPDFILIDGDYRCEAGNAPYVRFIRGGAYAISTFQSQVQKKFSEPSLDSDLAQLEREYDRRRIQLIEF